MHRRSIVVVQSESFFDARRASAAIPGDLLRRWDEVGAEAAYRGRLAVPAWGGNTQRSEFAFLTGLPNEALGVHRFNPYLKLATQPVFTIAHQLRALGYTCVCIHPYHGAFFNRDKVLPNLGFDRFLDIEAFDEDARFGPYVSDRAVTEKILATLAEAGRPHFVFAITMENHGQWASDRLAGEVASGPRTLSPEAQVYLRHLANADAMIGDLAGALRARDDDTVLCMYGDHVPSLPELCAPGGDGRTDYVVWRPSHQRPCHTVDVAAHELARLVLETAFDETSDAGAAAAV